MSAPYGYDAYPNTHHINYSSHSQDDVKVGFDDLIDEYSRPYAANANHQTFAVTAPAMESRGPDHRRGPSFPLGQKVTIAEGTKAMSDDTHDHSTIGAYPPITTGMKDTQPFWRKVRRRVRSYADLAHHPRSLSQNRWRVDCICSLYSSRR